VEKKGVIKKVQSLEKPLCVGRDAWKKVGIVKREGQMRCTEKRNDYLGVR